MPRDSVSRSLRFDIFDRDHFVCQYCGKRPPEVTLECDHVIPASKGGPTIEENLTTSCFDCNRGKGAKEISPPGDPSERLVSMAERVEQMEAYRVHLEQLLSLKDMELRILVEHWHVAFETDTCDVVSRLRTSLVYNPPHKIIEAMDITAGKFPNAHGREYAGSDVLRYFYGVLKGMREERA